MSTLETITVLIVLILATLVAFQFGSALIVKQAVSHAATVAAREAAKGANETRIAEVIDRILAPHRITVGDGAAFVLENPDPQAPQGDSDCQPPPEPAIDSDEVRVTICVSLTARSIMNILKPYGIDFTGKEFTVSSVAAIES
jgi:hypothetical protein